MLQIQGVRGCSCSVLPQTLGNEGYAVYSAFPQGKKHVNFIKILEFTQGRFQIFKSNFSKAVRLLSFLPLWHVFYATMGITLVGLAGLEPAALCLKGRYSTSWVNGPILPIKKAPCSMFQYRKGLLHTEDIVSASVLSLSVMPSLYDSTSRKKCLRGASRIFL